MAQQTLRARFARLAAPERRYVVFYDASCGICRRLRHWLEQRQPDAPMRFLDINDRATRDRWLDITPAEARQQVIVLDPAGRLSAGYDAIVRLMEAVGPGEHAWPQMLRRAGVKRIGARAYDMVSHHRHQLSRWLFGERTPPAAAPRAVASPPPAQRSRAMPSEADPPRRAARNSGRTRDRSVIKGAIAGAVGGLVASFVMEQAQMMTQRAAERRQRPRQQPSARGTWGDGQKQEHEHEQKQDELRSGHEPREGHAADTEQGTSSEPATVQAARTVSRLVRHRDLDAHEKPAAGEAMHYGFGATVGAAYGVLAELAPTTRKYNGLTYGTVVWLFADEIGVPLAGLGEPPEQQDAETHAYALGSHLIYGFTLETTRRIVRAVLG